MSLPRLSDTELQQAVDEIREWQRAFWPAVRRVKSRMETPSREWWTNKVRTQSK